MTELFNVVQIRVSNVETEKYLFKNMPISNESEEFQNGRTGHVYHYVASALLLTTVRRCRSKIKLFFHSRLISDVQ